MLRTCLAVLFGGLILLAGCNSTETLTQSCFATSAARTNAGLSGQDGTEESASQSASSGSAAAESASGCDYAKKAE